MSGRRVLAFVRALQRQQQAAIGPDGAFVVITPQRKHILSAAECAILVSDGVLQRVADRLLTTRVTTGWVRRQLATQGEQFTSQHRSTQTDKAHITRNAFESPLGKLAARASDKNGMSPHQLEAGQRFSRLFERAALRQRTTMSYDPQRVASTGNSAPSDKSLSGMNIDARREIERVYAALPSDCVGVIIDVCGFEKGLQQIESERGWPRRSARLVLKIALDQLAMHFGLMPVATGRDAARLGGWIAEDARPMQLG